jgi:lipid A ethanolaminephosphotransferase
MFSLQGRADFDRERSQYQDNLLDIAARAGYRVLWLDNGNSCKKVCARVESRDLHLSHIAGLCRDNECFDEVLIRELEHVLAEVTEDTLIVLHQMGSHGPAYSLRHPDKFKVFGPECTASDLGECNQAEITNAYDNTILYTDQVIDQAIGALAARDDELDTALIYVSDHGESLGEHGLYLHGMPDRLAPSEQTHVPMLTWFSPGFAQREGLTGNCTRQLAGTPVSHDYLFHTTLALLDIRTAVYQPDLDLFAACRPHKPIGTAHAATTAAL